MKMKEVCARTGLSRKTIRLYEEKELLVPRKEVRNGRVYRDYSEEDVQTLLVVASLRKAWFTMEEIRRMQQDPAAIGEILPQYREWLYAQKRQLDGLIAAADKLAGRDIASVAELSAGIETETKNLPLPVTDIKPRFKYLDEMEQRLPVEIDEQAEAEKQRQNEAWARRRIILQVSKAKYNDYNFSLGLLRDTRQVCQEPHDVPVRELTDPDPKWLRRIKAVCTGLVVLMFVVLTLQFLRHPAYRTGPIWLWLGLLAAAGGVRGLLELAPRAAGKDSKKTSKNT